ncbi:MAG: CaiB/BaiF CoA transferase family protein [Lysobacterales bacterium]
MGPLNGYKLIEIAGIGPGQLCGMLLADMGAQIIRIDRPVTKDLGVAMPARFNLMNRSRPTIAVDLKTPEGIELVLRLCEDADGLFEGYRPGVMEKLGLGPKACMAKNAKLVFGRMTGWGQDGPLADSVGHDSNYIALAGALGSIGDKDRPPPVPLNLIGDFGGGALYLAMGMLAAMLEASRSGKGQVVDAAMVDGVASMMTLFYGLQAGGMWTDARQSNLLDGAAPFVKNYETGDGKFVAVCALESRFFTALLDAMEITDIAPSEQHNTKLWPEHQQILTGRFKQKTRDEWRDILEGTDACAAPVLSLSEAPDHPHSHARESYVRVDGIRQPAPAPRFSRTPSSIAHAPTEPGEHDQEALSQWGLSASEIEQLASQGVLQS